MKIGRKGRWAFKILGSTIFCSWKALVCESAVSQEQLCAERHRKAFRAIQYNTIDLTDSEGNLCTEEPIAIDC